MRLIFTIAVFVSALASGLDAQNRSITIQDGNGNVRSAAVDANKNLGVVLPAETTKVLGTIRITGNVGAVFDAATGAAPPANGVAIIGIGSGATGGLMRHGIICDTPFDIAQTAGEQLLAGVSGRKIYICSMNLVTATAQNIAIVSGTGTVCATGTTRVSGSSGGSTAATGWNLAANGGIVLGAGANGGKVAETLNAADNLCLLQSGSGQISGGGMVAIF